MIAPPRISGRALHSLAAFARTRVGALALKQVFLADLKVTELAKLPDSLLGDMPLDNRPLQGRPPRGASNEAPNEKPAKRPWSGGSDAYVEAYKAGKITPSDVVAHALAAARSLGQTKPSMTPMLDYADASARREAAESTGRYAKGAPLSALDGVPIVVKEELAVRGLPRRGGSPFESAVPSAQDATFVARLRAAGAIVLGTTVMTEYGMNPIGVNPRRTMPRNPHAPDRVAGGSSTGSGVAVATGLVPIALGGDGGGSIRIPSSLNGIFGLKATWGRISRHGDVFGGSVAHVGPMASSVIDLARVLDLVAATDPDDDQTKDAPAVEAGAFVRATARGVRGLRIGVDANEWSSADATVAKAGKEALDALVKGGAVLVDVKTRLVRFAAAIGYLTIGPESRAAMREKWRERASEFTLDLQVSYSVLGELGVLDYTEGQRMRSGLRREMANLFHEIDLFALPTTVTTATKVTDAEMESGFVDPRALDSLCRFNFMGNLTGLPALTAPVGLDANKLPIGLQLVGDAWDEATVLAAAAHLERVGAARVEKPTVSVAPLPRR